MGLAHFAKSRAKRIGTWAIASFNDWSFRHRTLNRADRQRAPAATAKAKAKPGGAPPNPPKAAPKNAPKAAVKSAAKAAPKVPARRVCGKNSQ